MFQAFRLWGAAKSGARALGLSPQSSIVSVSLLRPIFLSCAAFSLLPANAPAKRKNLFQNKNTSAQSTLGDTDSLTPGTGYGNHDDPD